MSTNLDRHVEWTSTRLAGVRARSERWQDAVGSRLLCAGGGEALIGQAACWAAEARYRTVWATNPHEALEYLSAAPVDLLVLGLGEHPEAEMAWWSARLESTGCHPQLLVISRFSSIRLVMHAERLRAAAVLTPPLTPGDFLAAVKGTLRRPKGQRVPLPDVAADPVGGQYLVGQSQRILAVRRMIARLAPAETSVLILGESGTGKELVARAIHEFGPRAHEPFVAVNCAAIPETLLESELFGHERGAFTGALVRRSGRFERANGGTLFLDEIADMSPALQAKILRAVQDRQIERVGGTHPLPVNVRLIAATNRNLQTAIERGEFRADLYYRLAVVTVQLPSLAERTDDLLLLISHFTRRFATLYGKTITHICDRALVSLRMHTWPGNIRELRNVIERAVVLADGDTLKHEYFLPDAWSTSQETSAEPIGPTSLEEVEARHIARVLQETDGSVTEAARILGIHRNSLARKIRRYGL